MQTYFVIAVQLLSHVWLFVTPWTAAHQASLSVTKSQSLLKLMSIELVMPSNHLILCHPLLLSPSIFPSIRVFSNESALHNRWAKYWNFIFSISPSNDSGWISFRIDWSSCCPRDSQESLCYSSVKKKKFPKSIGLEQYKFTFALKSVGHLLVHTRFGWPEKTLVVHSWTVVCYLGTGRSKTAWCIGLALPTGTLVMMEPCVFHYAAAWFRTIDMAVAGFQERVRLQRPLRSRLETGHCNPTCSFCQCELEIQHGFKE